MPRLIPSRLAAPLAALAVLVAAAPASAAAAPVTTLESTGPAGVPGNAASGDSSAREVALSGDGRFLAFTSEASNLVAGDRNGTWDVFLRDRRSGALTRLGAGNAPDISNDGRFVAYVSGGRPSSVRLYDRRSGRSTRVSNRHPAARGRRVSALRPAISPDGRYVAYPAVRRLGSGGDSDTVSLGVFLYDRKTGRTTRVAGEDALDAAGVSLSRGARHVAFVSSQRLSRADRNRRPDAYVLDRRTGRLTLASRGTDRAVFNPVLSARGDRLAFETDATNLAPGTARRGYKVLVRDLRAGRTVLASVGTDGRPVTDDATSAALSRDGRFVAFQVSPLNGPIGDFEGPIGEVLVRDLARRTTVVASITPAGAPSERSGYPALSGDGRFVAFTSAAAMVETDANGLMDIFVRGPLR